MKKQPLKNKRIDFDFRIAPDLNWQYCEGGEYALIKDVKSAVEWLKEQVKNETTVTKNKIIQNPELEALGCDTSCEKTTYTFPTSERVLELIDEAFEDVK